MSPPTVSGVPLAPYPDETLTALCLNAIDRYRHLPALGRATSLARLTFGEVEQQVARLVAVLSSLGVAPGDRVAILSENRPEWVITDYAVLSLGAISVPVYPTLPASQVAAILDDCDARLVFVSSAEQANKIAAPRFVVTFDAPPGDASTSEGERVEASGQAPRITSLASLLEQVVAEPDRDWRTQALAASPDDLATLIYTSGTTGTPKGVMLTHANLAAMVAATGQHGSIVVAPGDVVLSFLPLSHVLERAASYFFFAQGATVVYAESMQTVPRDLAAVRPHHVVSVPRLFDKVYDAVVGAPGLKGTIARWAARTAYAYASTTTAGERPSPVLRLKHALADRLVYHVLRDRVGGRLRTFICGGAPLEPRVCALFLAAGLPVYEGYGLTETSPVLAANKPGATRLGTVGVPYPGVEVRLGDEGEIQVRGPSVMRGYWRQPEATAAAFTADGWLRTGDVGEINEGFLHVVDRLKDLIVTAGGKNVAPQPLEQRVASSPLISQAVLLGDRRPYLVMLVVPDFTVFDQLHGDERDRPTADGAGKKRTVVDDARVQARVAAEVATALHDVARVERPKRVAVLADEFTVNDGLLTPTLKVRRRAVEALHGPLLDSIYAGQTGVEVRWEAATTGPR